MKYRKKPVVVEAVQWTGDLPPVARFVGAENYRWGSSGPFAGGGLELWVAANQRWLPLEFSEWIIRDSRGFYPCKPDIFAATYEPVEEA